MFVLVVLAVYYILKIPAAKNKLAERQASKKNAGKHPAEIQSRW